MRDELLPLDTHVVITGWSVGSAWRGLTGRITAYRYHAHWGHFEGYRVRLDDTLRAREVTRSNGWRQRKFGISDEAAALEDLGGWTFGDGDLIPVTDLDWAVQLVAP